METCLGLEKLRPESYEAGRDPKEPTGIKCRLYTCIDYKTLIL